MIRLETETPIPAPPERVWSALVGFANYPAWHPHQVIEGIAEPGAKVRIKGRLLGSSEVSSNTRWTILRCERPRLIDFGAGWPSIFRLRQWFEIRPHPQGCLLIQGTGFEGVIPKIVLRKPSSIERFRLYHDAVARQLTALLTGSPVPGPVGENRRQRRFASKKQNTATSRGR